MVTPHHLLSHDHMATAWSLAELGRCAGEAPAEILATLGLLLKHDRDAAGGQLKPVLEVMVTHDTIVGAIANCLLGAPILGEDWPLYLEGLFFWEAADGIHVVWRGDERILKEVVL